jgi:hypothetical protein
MIEVQCPHCNGTIIIEELNCRIFRHAVLKENGNQINPHAPKEECENYIEKDMIYGCGKPFIVVNKDDKYIAEICDYI